MSTEVSGKRGPTPVGAGGTQTPFRQSGTGEINNSQVHGRYYEQAVNGLVFSTGHTAFFSLVAANATATGLTATAQPVLGVYNPSSSTVNVVILQAGLQAALNNVTSVALGAWVIATSVGNAAVTTGLTPFNRKTLTASGSQAKGYAGATVLTGLTNSLVVQEAIEIPTASSLLTTTVAAATPTPSVGGTVLLDGQWIVPPGGVFAIMNTLAVTTHSVWGKLVWEEVPLI